MIGLTFSVFINFAAPIPVNYFINFPKFHLQGFRFLGGKSLSK